MIAVLKEVSAETLRLLSQTMLRMYSKPGSQMVSLLFNNRTMSRVPAIYSALGGLQSAFPSLHPENKAAKGAGRVLLSYEAQGR